MKQSRKINALLKNYFLWALVIYQVVYLLYAGLQITAIILPLATVIFWFVYNIIATKNKFNKYENFHISEAVSFVCMVGFVICFAYFIVLHIYLHFFEWTLVKNKSMEPTITHGDHVLLEKFSLGLIISPAYYSKGPQYAKIHRMQNTVLRELQKGDIITFFFEQKKQILIKRVVATGDNHVIVAGDNADHSEDSKIFGPVPKDKIIGRVIYIKSGTQYEPNG